MEQKLLPSGSSFVPGSMGHTMPQPPKRKVSLATSIIFISLILLLGGGGLYFWGKFVESSETVVYTQQ